MKIIRGSADKDKPKLIEHEGIYVLLRKQGDPIKFIEKQVIPEEINGEMVYKKIKTVEKEGTVNRWVALRKWKELFE